MSGAAQIELSQWILQAEKARDFADQRQRSQVLDRKAAVYARVVFGDLGEHLLDLSLHAVLDAVRGRCVAEVIFGDGLESLAGESVAAADGAVDRRVTLAIAQRPLTNYRPAWKTKTRRISKKLAITRNQWRFNLEKTFSFVARVLMIYATTFIAFVARRHFRFATKAAVIAVVFERESENIW